MAPARVAVKRDVVSPRAPGGAGSGGSGTYAQILAWVPAHFAVATVGSNNVYDLTKYAG
jgi:hypothetical protein